jgi:hypothetical protein
MFLERDMTITRTRNHKVSDVDKGWEFSLHHDIQTDSVGSKKPHYPMVKWGNVYPGRSLNITALLHWMRWARMRAAANSTPHSQQKSVRWQRWRVYRRSQNCETWLFDSLYMSVRPHWTATLPLDGFSRNLIFETIFLGKSVDRNHVSIKSDKNSRYFILGPMYLYDNTSLNAS